MLLVEHGHCFFDAQGRTQLAKEPWESHHPIGGDSHGLKPNYNQLGKWRHAKDWLSDGAGFTADNWRKADSPPNTFEAYGSGGFVFDPWVFSTFYFSGARQSSLQACGVRITLHCPRSGILKLFITLFSFVCLARISSRCMRAYYGRSEPSSSTGAGFLNVFFV